MSRKSRKPSPAEPAETLPEEPVEAVEPVEPVEPVEATEPADEPVEAGPVDQAGAATQSPAVRRAKALIAASAKSGFPPPPAALKTLHEENA